MTPALAVSCVGTLTWLRAMPCGAVRGNTGAIREEIGAFISLSSVHLASITGLSLYTDLCVCVCVCEFMVLGMSWLVSLLS